MHVNCTLEISFTDILFINEPTHEIMVLITQATSEGLGEPADPGSLARAFAVRTHRVLKLFAHIEY